MYVTGTPLTCQGLISATFDIIHDTHDPVSGPMRMIDACLLTMVLTFSAMNGGSCPELSTTIRLAPMGSNVSKEVTETLRSDLSSDLTVTECDALYSFVLHFFFLCNCSMVHSRIPPPGLVRRVHPNPTLREVTPCQNKLTMLNGFGSLSRNALQGPCLLWGLLQAIADSSLFFCKHTGNKRLAINILAEFGQRI